MSIASSTTRSTTATSTSTTPVAAATAAATALAVTRVAPPRLHLAGALGSIAEDTAKSPALGGAGAFKYPSPSISPTPPYGSRLKGISAATVACKDEAHPAVAFTVDKRFVPTAAAKPSDRESEPKIPPLALRSASTVSTEDMTKAPGSPALETGDTSKLLDSPSLPTGSLHAKGPRN